MSVSLRQYYLHVVGADCAKKVILIPVLSLLITNLCFQDQKGEELSTQTWLGDVQYEDNRASICGLEISFSSVPQDIDIKLIPGNSNCAIDNQGISNQTYLQVFYDMFMISASGSEAKVDARPTAPSDSSASQPLETEPDQNKTRQ